MKIVHREQVLEGTSHKFFCKVVVIKPIIRYNKGFM